MLKLKKNGIPAQDPPSPERPPATFPGMDAGPAPALPAALPKAKGSAGWLSRFFPLKREAQPVAPVAPVPLTDRPVSLLVFQPLAGGAGTTTLAVSYACAIAATYPDLKVLLLDLNLQFGGVGLHLDLPETMKVVDAYARMRSLDDEGFRACLQSRGMNLSVFTAPAEVVPLDALGPDAVKHLLTLARGVADILVVDLPLAVADWSAEVWQQADYLALNGTMEVRSAAGLRRLSELAGRDLIHSTNCHILLNRVPERRPPSWLEEYLAFTRPLGRKVPKLLPEGGGDVSAALATGQALPLSLPANPLAEAVRQEIATLTFTTRGRQPSLPRSFLKKSFA